MYHYRKKYVTLRHSELVYALSAGSRIKLLKFKRRWIIFLIWISSKPSMQPYSNFYYHKTATLSNIRPTLACRLFLELLKPMCLSAQLCIYWAIDILVRWCKAAFAVEVIRLKDYYSCTFTTVRYPEVELPPETMQFYESKKCKQLSCNKSI